MKASIYFIVYLLILLHINTQGKPKKSAYDISKNDDEDMSAYKEQRGGILMKIVKPRDAKPMYINMSPIYDFRGYYII